MNMKNLLNLLLLFPVMSIGMVGCQSEDATYSGPEFVMFADTIYTMPIVETGTAFEVPVAATTTANYDRNYTVEVDNSKSTAVRGFHFDFADGSNNVTIKAGERVANVRLKGYYNNVQREDSLVVSLRLVEPKSQQWDLYGNTTRVDFVLCPPFKMNDFLQIKNDNDEAHFTMLASFPFGNQTSSYAVEGYKKDEKTLMLTSMFGNSATDPIRVIFDDSDPLDLKITVPEQKAFRESSYGYVWIHSVDQYPSYFNTFDNFFVLILEAYVPQIGSFGVYQYIFKCIDSDEAANNNNGTATRSVTMGESLSTTFTLHKY